MNIDQYGLPVQLDRDASDQLQRVGMLAIVYHLDAEPVEAHYKNAVYTLLQPKPGIYSRYTGATTLDVTGDQLIPVIAYWVLTDCSELMWRRLFFAQNVRKQGEPNVRTFPDFMVFRALPLFCRASYLLSLLGIIADILLVFAVVIHCLTNTGMDDVDDNNLIVTLVTCQAKYPTWLSRFACYLYNKMRKTNYGCILYNTHPILGALYWYHRPEWPSYGNPEIAQLWAPLVSKYILNRHK